MSRCHRPLNESHLFLLHLMPEPVGPQAMLENHEVWKTILLFIQVKPRLLSVRGWQDFGGD